MKIKSLKYQNFRNYGEKGEITFDTDGKLTIIYGTNGDGKTTLHQLFQWILYERVTFNKTTSQNKLYNLENGKKLPPESSMRVWGEISFEHFGIHYVARREWVYYKNKSGEITHKLDGDVFTVQRQVYKNSDWKRVDNPEMLIEEMLPSGLATYFFFDGETMIADLKVRGTDSARSLRKALYSIFDLQIYENALRDLGNSKKSSSVLGSLENKKLDALKKSTSEKVMQQHYRDIKRLSATIEELETKNEEFEQRINDYKKRIIAISEEIGNNKSRKVLENTRNILKNDIKKSEERIKAIKMEYGKEIENNYSHLLIAKVAEDAEKRLYLHVQDEEEKIIPGLSKELLINLLSNSDRCICGNCIAEKEKIRLEEWRNYFPPASYKSTYDKFNRDAIKYSGKYSENSLVVFLTKILSENKSIRDFENSIDELEEEIKKSGNVDELIEERKRKEKDVTDLEREIKNNTSEIGECEKEKKLRERRVSTVEGIDDQVVKYKGQIELAEKVCNVLRKKLIDETREYSHNLEKEIQYLIDTMLTSKREVSLSEEFQLQVKDSHGDESKSEGQFAVISFAYIGGILKVLKNHDKLKGKEYPLILDGPFSKLDETQKMNVVTTIPQYAPQVIIFSKDPLDKYVEKNQVGKVYTIRSNIEKNNAVIEEGYLWK